MSETKSDSYEAVAYLEADTAERFKEFLIYSGIKDVSTKKNPDNDTYSVGIPSSDFEKASNLYHVFCENELENNNDDSSSSDVSDDFISSGGNLYESSSDKYKDNLSSAITFFVCGGIGIVILLLNYFGIIHLVDKSSSSFILINVILALLFIAFIAIGLWSLKYSKTIKASADNDNKVSKEIFDWLENNITAGDIEASYNNDIPEEMKYFSRSSYVKDQISSNFPDCQEELKESISDSYIEKLFN